MNIRPGHQELARPLPRRLRVARLVGELLSPPPILAVLALVIAWASSPTPAMAILWGGITAVSASMLPHALILRGVRRGRLSDRNISLRAQRVRFAAVAIASILTGLVLLAAFDAPAEMVALQASVAAGVACGWVITLWWKISVHAAIAAGAATVLLLVFGLALLVVWPLVAVIAWSRSRSATTPQPRSSPASPWESWSTRPSSRCCDSPALRPPARPAINDPRLSRDRPILRKGGHGR
jgi:hypothetical protein